MVEANQLEHQQKLVYENLSPRINDLERIVAQRNSIIDSNFQITNKDGIGLY